LLPPLVLGVGDGRGFSGHVSAAKLALADALDPVCDGFELRIHGVGGSSPEQLLEQSETVQVGGDDTAQFLRRVAVARQPTVEWPLEGYWWGGLTSNAPTRAFWVFLVPLTLCNLASWMAPVPPRSPERRQERAARWLPRVMRLAGYALTLLLAASLATAAIDVFGWQCEQAPAMQGVPGRCSPLDRLPGWLRGVLPEAPGPRLVIFALVPVLVLALIGYACHRTLRSYERWTLPTSLPGDSNNDQNAQQAADDGAPQTWWPLTAGGFWHGLRPVRRQQLLHLAGAAALISLYLALVPASHPGWRVLAVIVTVALLVPPAVLLLFPQGGRPGVNPRDRSSAAMKWGGFDWWCVALLAVSVAALVTLLLARIWWRPIAPAPPKGTSGWTGVGLLPGDGTIWGWLTVGMAVLLLAAATLTWLAKGKDAPQLDRLFHPFAKGFLAPLTLGLAFVTGGIFAAGLNLLLPHLLIGKQYQKTAPAISGIPWKTYPLRLPVPTYGFIFAFLGLAATTVLFAAAALFFWGIPKWRETKPRSHLKIFYEDDKDSWYEDEKVRWKAERQRHKIAVSWTKARLASYLGVAVTVLSLAGIAFVAAFDGLALAWNPVTQSWLPAWAQAGQWLLLPTIVFLYGYTLQAYKDDSKRRSIGVLWDVGNFWPRASQPLAPPCYMERSIPETVNRLRRALGDKYRVKDNRGYEFKDRKNPDARTDPAADPAEEDYIEEHIEAELGKEAAGRIVLPRQKWVLINGYSQGTPIAAAVIAQLPQELRDKVTLVTVGCPLRRLYGRAFPAYFGQDCLLDFASKLTAGQPPAMDLEDAKVNVLPETRWRNLIRPSDYVGAHVFENTMELDPEGEVEIYKNGDCLIDKRLLDPPRIIPTHGNTPPPIHEHSDYWPDAQTALHTEIAVREAQLRVTPGNAAADRLRLHRELADAYTRVGNHRQAVEHAQELLPRAPGADDTSILAIRADIQDWAAKALQLTQERLQVTRELVLPRQEQKLGRDHRATLATRARIADWTGESGNPAGAQRLLEELLPDQVQVLGPYHPATLATRARIADCTGQGGNTASALRLLEELQPDQVQVLGPYHPATLATRARIANWTGECGNAAAALQLLEELQPDQVRVLGTYHPATLATRARIANWVGHRASPVN
jgi:hypothetical protein